MKTGYFALIGRIKRISQDLEKVVSRTQSLMDKAQRTGDDGYLDGVALNLHGFYAGVEKIFEDIARTLEKDIPDAPGWHQDLFTERRVLCYPKYFLQQTTDIEGLRSINLLTPGSTSHPALPEYKVWPRHP